MSSQPVELANNEHCMSHNLHVKKHRGSNFQTNYEDLFE